MRYIRKLKLQNFRCYGNFEIEFKPQINLIVGGNAVGKTSLVEAVYCLGLGKSFKTRSDQELIKKGQSFAVINSIFEPGSDEILFSIDGSQKKIIRNNLEYDQLSQHLGFINVVIFTPEDLELVKGSPQIRRTFLDVFLSQTDKVYLQALIKYKRLLKQRNEALKNYGEKFNKEYIDTITDALITEAKVIVSARNSFLSKLLPIARQNLLAVSSEKEKLQLVYKPSVNVDNMWKTFQEKRDYDILLQTTTIGPHRDDFSIYLNDKLVNVYGSQGQQRSVSLAMKLGCGELLKAMNLPLIIILDDVFSELDEKRQNNIFEIIKKYNQVFITTTSINNISENLKEKYYLIDLMRREN